MPFSRAPATVSRRVSPASCCGCQLRSRLALAVSIRTGVSRAVAHSSLEEAKVRRRAAAAPAVDRGAGTRDRAPAELAGDVGDPDLALAGEVVDAGRAVAADRRRHRSGDVVVVDELERHPRVGQDRLHQRQLFDPTAQRRHRVSRPHCADGLLDQHRRPRPGDDAGAEDVGVHPAPEQQLVEQALQLGLLRRVVEALASRAAGRPRSAAGGCRGGSRRRRPRRRRRAARRRP